MLPTTLLPAPVKGTTVGLVELPEALLVALRMTVNAGAEHDVVGADVRVTIRSVEVVVGHDLQTMVESVALAAASHVYEWKAGGTDVSFELLNRVDWSCAYQTRRGRRRNTSYWRV